MKKQIKKKSNDLLKRIQRSFHSKDIYSKKILLNSFPKSGTHLLSQIIESIEPFNFRGVLLANYASLSGKRRKESNLIKVLQSSKKNEIIHAHLFYSNEINKVLNENNFRKILLIRDLRDVVCSEERYYSHINKLNHMHKHFLKIDSLDKRLSACINGLNIEGKYFPSIKEKFMNYINWIDDDQVLIIRFEELSDPLLLNSTISNLVNFITGEQITDSALNSIKENINPSSSHTYSGKSRNWKNSFSNYNIEEFESVAGDLNRKLGY
jgi:hypothetical protein